MDHLDAAEIIEFVTADVRDGSSRENIARVNLHILNCRECLSRVKAFSIIYGEGLSQTAQNGKRCMEERKGLTLNGKKIKRT